MDKDTELDRSRIVLNDTDFDRLLTILETSPRLSPEATERLRRKPVWDNKDAN